MTFQTNAGTAGGRLQYLDLLKTLLVWGMIAAHVIQLLGFGLKPWHQAYSDFINLVTFSGFMFAFGLGVGLPSSGTSSRQKTLWQRLWPALLLLLAVYASSIAFVVLADRKPLTPERLADLLSMRVLFGWSEFLASFFVLYLVIATARPALLWIGRNPFALIAAVGLCLLSTRLVVSINLPLLAAVVGTTNFASFPILAYLPWFLVGIYLGGQPLKWWHFAIGLGATAGFYLFARQLGEFPQRFPPSALWVIGPALFLLLYLAVAKAVAARIVLPAALLLPGRHVLSFLLLSNLVIFTVRYFLRQPVRDTWQVVLVTLAIMIAISGFWVIADALRRPRTPAAAAAG